MKRIVTLGIGFVYIAFLLTGCGVRQEKRNLSDIESYIDIRPDSALTAIRQIDTNNLRNRANKAKYALLHAMALDKNYIDTADTRVIKPAVEYYEHHGSAEQKVKTLMYLGTEQFNAGSYNQAIVSYGQAVELSDGMSDYNLKGVLYSKIAETFTRSQEFVQASDYLDKAIKCFEVCNRPDQLTLARIMKAINLLQLRDWEKSDELFKSILSEKSLSGKQKGSAEGYYALMISYNPFMPDTTAFAHFKRAIALNGYLEDTDQYCAYAYLLGLLGNMEESDMLFDRIDLSDYRNKYAHDYWKHRLYLNKKDFKQAYYSLWSARNVVDSITRVNISVSAARAQRIQMESMAIQKQLIIQNQRWMIVAISLMVILVATVASVLYSRVRRKNIEEHDRMEIVIDHLNHKIDEMESEKAVLVKDKTKAKFKILASIYEDVYHLLGANGTLPKEKAYQIINAQTRILGNDQEAQTEFEKSLNEESGNIMYFFRRDFPDLTPEEYRLASYLFAGFDNTTIMLIMGISTLEYTRVKKNRLKNKIQKQPGQFIDNYLRYFK